MPDKTNDFLAYLPSVHRALHRWYKVHGRRELPWRTARDPYSVYISEIMLQQTQVKTVLDRYYGPFLKKFPTLAALAKADRQSVMKQWEGLGYYTRAGNLHAAAQQSTGKLPATVEGLMALPGIGRNTAHAVACFGFGVAVPVMEANVKRVLCRVFALKKANDKLLWQRAEQLLDKKNPFDYNQAMMDIGSLVCTKRSPKCEICPLAVICKGKVSPESYPLAKVAKQVPVRERVIVVMQDKDKYYLMLRKTRFLNGLYGFMEYETTTRAAEFMGNSYTLSREHLLGAVEQSYSHFTLQAKVYLVPVTGSSGRAVAGFTKATLKEMRRLPLSRADLKIVQMLAERH